MYIYIYIYIYVYPLGSPSRSSPKASSSKPPRSRRRKQIRQMFSQKSHPDLCIYIAFYSKRKSCIDKPVC